MTLLIPQIINSREIDIDGQKIRLQANTVILSDKVTVHIDVQTVPSQPYRA
ncbi:MAG: hypothetical protein ABRQ24_06395 [Syntrophomonadaceae bacterium]